MKKPFVTLMGAVLMKGRKPSKNGFRREQEEKNCAKKENRPVLSNKNR
jgi:hypothetical protein